MVSKLIKEIKKNSPDCNLDISEFNKLSQILLSKDYLSFLKETNGGSIFNTALHFYGVLSNEVDSEIFYNNYLLKKYYSQLINFLLAFAEDAFGNQYVFLEDNRIGLVNIETAEIDCLFTSFEHFITEVYKEPEYYTGYPIIKKWVQKNGLITDFKRLCPIKPFVIGGDYEIDNFYVLEKDKLLDYNSFIAQQIKDLPDGTVIQLKVI